MVDSEKISCSRFLLRKHGVINSNPTGAIHFFGYHMNIPLRRPKRLFIPAFSIVFIVILLLVLISVSTYRNLDRDKKKVRGFVHRQGVMLIHTLEAGVRAGLRQPRRSDETLELLMRETAESEDVAYVYLIDGSGKTIFRSDAPGTDDENARKWPERIEGEHETILTRLRTRPDHVQVFEFAKRFEPFHPNAASTVRMPGVGQATQGRGDEDMIIVVALKMQAFEEARQTDFHHAVIMASIVLALGSGAIFFIFVIQNYYLVNRTLRQTRDYTRLVVEHMANGLLSIDRSGNVLSFNRPALEMLGVNEADLLELNLRVVIDFTASGIDETLSHCAAVLEKEIRHKIPFRGESDRIIPLAMSVTPILDDAGECQGAVIVLRDLTQIRLLEAKVRRTEQLAAIGKLAAVVAHEVRNPLSSIKGLAQFLRQGLKDRPKVQQYVEVMITEVDRINQVVTDLLVIARPFEAERMPTDIVALIDHVIMLVQADADSRRIAIHRDCAADIGLVSLDGDQMKPALLNLLLNALQSIVNNGRIDIGVSMDQHAGMLHLWVADDGPGIPPEDQQKIFEPYFTTREKGTGLGLAIVQKIVENHDGVIQVESPMGTTGHGCRFDLTIPIDGKANSIEADR